MPSKKQIVESWNKHYPVGTPVRVMKDKGDEVETVTVSEAELLGGHTPVVWLEGISGCYALERVLPR